MTQTTNEREAFENMARKRGWNIERTNDDYVCDYTRMGWIAWQARGQSSISQNEQQEAVAWRYVDSRGKYRYRGYADGFDIKYISLKPVKLYTSPPKQAIPEGWISTKDRLPDQLELKIKLIDGSEIYAWYQLDGDYYWNCGGCEIFIDESKVTHWMPLPSPTNTEVGE